MLEELEPGPPPTALAEEGAQRLECVEQDQAEEGEDAERDQGQLDAEVEEDPEGEDRRQEPADELDEPRPDEVADALGVRHAAQSQIRVAQKLQIVEVMPVVAGKPVDNGSLG